MKIIQIQYSRPYLYALTEDGRIFGTRDGSGTDPKLEEWKEMSLPEISASFVCEICKETVSETRHVRRSPGNPNSDQMCVKCYEQRPIFKYKKPVRFESFPLVK